MKYKLGKLPEKEGFVFFPEILFELIKQKKLDFDCILIYGWIKYLNIKPPEENLDNFLKLFETHTNLSKKRMKEAYQKLNDVVDLWETT